MLLETPRAGTALLVSHLVVALPAAVGLFEIQIYLPAAQRHQSHRNWPLAHGFDGARVWHGLRRGVRRR